MRGVSSAGVSARPQPEQYRTAGEDRRAMGPWRKRLGSSLVATAALALIVPALTGSTLAAAPARSASEQVFVNCERFERGHFVYHASAHPTTCTLQGPPERRCEGMEVLELEVVRMGHDDRGRHWPLPLSARRIQGREARLPRRLDEARAVADSHRLRRTPLLHQRRRGETTNRLGAGCAAEQ